MHHSDTIKLLHECNSGIKMGVSSIDNVLDKVEDSHFKSMLSSCKQKHQELGSKTHELLDFLGEEDREPPAPSKIMNTLMTDVKTAVKPGDSTIADLITQGCDMGVKSLNKYLNQYGNADSEAKKITHRLIKLEEQLTSDIAQYL